MLNLQNARCVFAFFLAVTPTMAGGATDPGITADQADRIILELSQIRALLSRQIIFPPPAQQPKANPDVIIETTGAQLLGSPDAPVTLVEFTDFQCPFCNRFYKEVFRDIRKNFVDTGKVRFFSRDLPLDFHSNAMQAAHSARCAAEQNQFWGMRDRMSGNPASLDMDTFGTYALELGMDVKAFSACVQSRKYQALIDADVAMAGRIGASGTPAFVIGKSTSDGVEGEVLLGALPYRVFEQKIKGLL